MTRSTAESKLEELRTFSLELSRNQTLVNNPEAKLRHIPIQATSYERELPTQTLPPALHQTNGFVASRRRA